MRSRKISLKEEQKTQVIEDRDEIKQHVEQTELFNKKDSSHKDRVKLRLFIKQETSEVLQELHDNQYGCEDEFEDELGDELDDGFEDELEMSADTRSTASSPSSSDSGVSETDASLVYSTASNGSQAFFYSAQPTHTMAQPNQQSNTNADTIAVGCQ